MIARQSSDRLRLRFATLRVALRAPALAHDDNGAIIDRLGRALQSCLLQIGRIANAASMRLSIDTGSSISSGDHFALEGNGTGDCGQRGRRTRSIVNAYE
jgi:hypothetical protein